MPLGKALSAWMEIVSGARVGGDGEVTELSVAELDELWGTLKQSQGWLNDFRRWNENRDQRDEQLLQKEAKEFRPHSGYNYNFAPQTAPPVATPATTPPPKTAPAAAPPRIEIPAADPTELPLPTNTPKPGTVSNPQTPEDFQRRAALYAEHEEWDAAAADWEAAIRLSPDDMTLRHNLAWSLLAGAKVEEFRSVADELLKRFPTVQTLDILSYSPDAKLDRAAIAEQAAQLAKLQHTSYYFQQVCGASLLRKGDFAPAKDYLAKADQLFSGSVPLTLYLGLCHHQLGDKAQALVQLSRADANIRARTADPLGKFYPNWNERLRWRLLRRELIGLLSQSKPRT